KYITSNSNQNVLRMIMKPCPAAKVLKKQSRFGGVRLVLAAFGQSDAPGSGQESIAGTIRLADGRAPAGVRVRLMGISKDDGSAVEIGSTVTDMEGGFVFKTGNMARFASYLLSARMAAYQTGIFMVPLGAVTLGDIVLQPATFVRAKPGVSMEPMLRYV